MANKYVKRFEMPNGEYVYIKDQEARESIGTLEEETGHINEDLANAKASIEDLEPSLYSNKKYIMIGDSIAEGYNPDGNVTGWPELLRSNWGLTNNVNCFIRYAGGAGFSAYGTRRKNFEDLLNELSDVISDKESITDIIVAGGVNDATNPLVTDANYLQAINSFCDNVKSNYPNAHIRFYSLNKTLRNDDAEKDASRLRTLKSVCKQNFTAYTYTIDAVSRISNFASDGLHLNQNGENQVANAISTGMFYDNRGISYTVNSDVVSNGMPNLTVCIHDNVTEIYIPFTILNINTTDTPTFICDGNTAYKLCDLTEGLWIGNNYGKQGIITTQDLTAKALIDVSSNPSARNYRDGEVTLLVYQKQLFMTVNLIAEDGTGWYEGLISRIILSRQNHSFISAA